MRVVYEDEALNSPVDVLYIDLTSQLKLENYLQDTINEDTLIIVKVKGPEEVIPACLKQGKDAFYFLGPWEQKNKDPLSEYYVVLM